MLLVTLKRRQNGVRLVAGRGSRVGFKHREHTLALFFIRWRAKPVDNNAVGLDRKGSVVAPGHDIAVISPFEIQFVVAIMISRLLTS